MCFYHENYHDAYYADAVLEDLRSGARRADDRTDEPISIPAILTWLVVATLAVCVIGAAIQLLG
jgi:hypothetical protein